MSNKASLLATSFEDCTGKSYGFRMYDDYAQTYCNSMEGNTLKIPPLELLDLIISEYSDEIIDDIIMSIWETNSGMYINDDWYEYKDLKETLEKYYA
jgi:hypothetical protein